MRNLMAIQSYFRSGVHFPELELLREFVFHPQCYTFTGELPSGWSSVYGASLGADVAFPEIGKAVAVEDRLSCIILWLLDVPARGIASDFGFLQARLGNAADYLIIEPKPKTVGQGDSEVTLKERIEARLAIDFGILRGLHFEPNFGTDGYVAALTAIGSYTVDIVTGETIDVIRNCELVNQLLSSDPEQPKLKVDPQFCFEPRHIRLILRAVVHGIHQYALLTRNQVS